LKLAASGILVSLSLLLCACNRPESHNNLTTQHSIPKADGYSFSELKRLHEAHDPKNWDTIDDTDQLRFGLLRTSEIFTTATISRGGPVNRLESRLDNGIGQVITDTPRGLLSLDDTLPQSLMDGMIIVRHGRIVFERYPNMRQRDRHLYWSVSNPFLGTLVGILADEGRIDIHAPIEQYICALSTTDWKGTAIIDILDMASGMSARELDVPNAYSDPSTLHYQFEHSLGNWATEKRTGVDPYDFVAQLSRLKPSGQVFEYASVNCFVISWLISEVTGKAYPDVISEFIWQKIGAEADAGIVVDRESGAPWSHGGIFSTLRDLARYGMLFTPSWNIVSEERIISSKHLARIQAGGRPELLERRNQEYPDQPAYTGEHVSTFQWDCVWPDGDFMKAGFNGQFIYISPSRDLVIAVFSSGVSASESSFLRTLATSGALVE
jgi:CubicO group peptidase (beta-lactamase class C family)